MLPPFDAVDRFGWTLLQFLARRPRKFFADRARSQKRYTEPLAFAASCLGIATLMGFVVAQSKANILQRDLLGSAVPPWATPQAALLMEPAAFFVFFVICLGLFKAAAWLMRCPISTWAVTVGFAYAAAIAPVLAAYQAGGLFFEHVLAGVVQPANTALVLQWGTIALMGAWFSIYLVPAVAAAASVPTARLGFGVVLVAALTVVVLGSGALVIDRIASGV